MELMEGRKTYRAVIVDVRSLEESSDLLLGEVETSAGQSLGQLRAI